MPPDVTVLLRRVEQRCRTRNELRCIQIAVENRFTPQQVRQLLDHDWEPVTRYCRYRESMDRWYRSLWLRLGRPRAQKLANWSRAVDRAAWLASCAALYRMAPDGEPQPFKRLRIARDLMLYSGGGGREGKTLLICFTGNSRRLMMPTSLLLQSLPADRVDVALLRDPSREAYRDGLTGLGGSLGELFVSLAERLRVDRYARSAALGTSAGGLPAVLAGLGMELNAAMSVGGNGVDDPRWRRVNPRALIEIYRARARSETAVHLVHGGDYPVDTARAANVASILPARLWPITSDTTRVGHNALYPLLERGELSHFLDATLVSGDMGQPECGVSC